MDKQVSHKEGRIGEQGHSPMTSEPAGVCRRHVFISAGESSGDVHGAALVRAILRQQPETRISALGGPLMRQAGAELAADLTGHAVMGLVEGIRHVGQIYSVFRKVVKRVAADRPDAVVLIDYPEFNLRLARRANKLGIPVIYYITPQLWAWRQWRVKILEKYVDKVLVIFPFEEEFYHRHNVAAEFVGHPLVDELAAVPDRAASRRALSLPEDATVIGLLPGSRRKEIDANFPIMARAAQAIRDRLGKPVTFLVAKAPSISLQQLQDFVERFGLDAKIICDDTYRAVRSSDLLLIASGTATVEAMILGTPMVVVYRVSTLTWTLFIRLMKVTHYAMVNIIAGREIVPECIQWKASSELIAREVLDILLTDRAARMTRDLAETTKLLRRPTAAEDPGEATDVPSRVAARILQFIERKWKNGPS
ncbi:MAG TPA: lipid-A-disaccharide synthase [Planctomycetota bacterium]|nr:lipid-A-disaccharide synthase [Planctomycetota bacterium]